MFAQSLYFLARLALNKILGQLKRMRLCGQEAVDAVTNGVTHLLSFVQCLDVVDQLLTLHEQRLRSALKILTPCCLAHFNYFLQLLQEVVLLHLVGVQF